MIREEDQIFARVVARHNLLPPEAIAEGLRALEGDGATSLRDVFVERGLLTRAQVAELERVASRVMQGGPIPGYELVRRIGRGGMGAVYEARQLSMSGRRVALKVVRLPLGHDRRAARRLLQEAKLIGTLDHPNIVTVFVTGIDRQAADKGRRIVAVDVETGELVWQFETACALTSDIAAFETNDELEPGWPSAGCPWPKRFASRGPWPRRSPTRTSGASSTAT